MDKRDQRDGSVVKRLPALEKDLNSVPSIYRVVYNHNSNSRGFNAFS